MDTPLPSDLQTLIISILASLDHIESHLIPSILSSTTSEDFETHATFGRDEFTYLDRKLDDAEVLGDECEDDNQCAQALDKIRELRERSARLRIKLRTTSLETKRKIASSSLIKSRSELLKQSTITKPDRSRSSNPDEALMSASTDVAESLKSTLNLMKQELDRSVLSTQMLEQQTKTLNLTSNQYITFSDLLTTSRQLITSIQRADVLDRLILGAALAFFMLVCLYILKKRILDRGLSLISTVSRIKPVLIKSTPDPISSPEGVVNVVSDVVYDAIAGATLTSAAVLPFYTPAPPSAGTPKSEPGKADISVEPVKEVDSRESLSSEEHDAEPVSPDEHLASLSQTEQQPDLHPESNRNSPVCSAAGSDAQTASTCSSDFQEEEIGSTSSGDSDLDGGSVDFQEEEIASTGSRDTNLNGGPTLRAMRSDKQNDLPNLSDSDTEEAASTCSFDSNVDTDSTCSTKPMPPFEASESSSYPNDALVPPLTDEDEDPLVDHDEL
ncbi:Sec20-domain-containing protein [Melampsora americana]|nr:Sec20-domain-containing protein [Melampsora americana]